MARIERIKKCRKPQVCGKCHKDIEVGQPYLIARRRYLPNVVRCTSCGMQSWETSSSEYNHQVGPIKYNWESDIGLSEDVCDEIATLLEEIRDEVSERHENMPEGLQYSETGELLENRVSELDAAIDELQSMDFDELRNQAVAAVLEDDEAYADADFPEYDELMASGDEELVKKLEEAYDEELRQAIEMALDNVTEP